MGVVSGAIDFSAYDPRLALAEASTIVDDNALLRGVGISAAPRISEFFNNIDVNRPLGISADLTAAMRL